MTDFQFYMIMGAIILVLSVVDDDPPFFRSIWSVLSFFTLIIALISRFA